MSEQFTEAFKRALFGGFFVGLLSVLTSWQVDPDWNRSLVNGGVVFLGYVIARGGFEGGLDTGRAERGDRIPSDVR